MKLLSGYRKDLYLGLFSSTFQSMIYFSSSIRPLCIILLMIIPYLPGEKQFRKSESNIAIDWFTKNEIIINPDKFQAIILDKKKSNVTNIPLTIDNQTIKSVPSVELLGIHLDDKLNFNLHISNICRSTANQLIRLKSYLSFNAKRVLINSYIISNFNYCFGCFLLLNP